MENEKSKGVKRKEWNPDILQRVHEQFQRAQFHQEWICVADSATMTQETLQQAKAARAYVITRGPNHLKIVKQLVVDAVSSKTNINFDVKVNKKVKMKQEMNNGLRFLEQ